MSKIRFQQLKVRRLSESIEESIKDLILTGQLKPGNRLPTETEISKQFGVSVVTVREALRGLEAFGIIKKKRGKDGGIFVSSAESAVVTNAMQSFLSSKNFTAQDLNEVRIIVEPASVKIAASRITPDELKGLDVNIKYCEKKIDKAKTTNTLSEKDFFDIEERNVEFHRLIGEATHNAILSLTIDYLEDFLLSFKKRTLFPDIEFSEKTISDHRHIYTALEKGDTRAAEREMVRHIRFIGDYLSSGQRSL